MIDDAIAILQQRPAAGEAVQRDRWPDFYRELELPNLFRYRVDRTHRMTYSIVKPRNDPAFVWIIEVMDHKQYNKRFGYH